MRNFKIPFKYLGFLYFLWFEFAIIDKRKFMEEYSIVSFMPDWAFVTLSIIFLAALLYLFIKIFIIKPAFFYYIEDNLYKIKWKWRWKKDKIIELYCFCPKCEDRLVYDDTSCKDSYSLNKETKFICEKCHFSSSLSGGDISYSLNIIEREINRKVRLDIYEK